MTGYDTTGNLRRMVEKHPSSKVKMRHCRCGEPEMLGLPGSGDFGWFTTDQGTFCQRCGRKQR